MKAYISGSAFVLLAGPNNLLQTIIPTEDDDELHAITVDPASGKIAVSTKAKVYVFVPLDHGYGAQAVVGPNVIIPRDKANVCTVASPEHILQLRRTKFDHISLLGSSRRASRWSIIPNTSIHGRRIERAVEEQEARQYHEICRFLT